MPWLRTFQVLIATGLESIENYNKLFTKMFKNISDLCFLQYIESAEDSGQVNKTTIIRKVLGCQAKTKPESSTGPTCLRIVA